MRRQRPKLRKRKRQGKGRRVEMVMMLMLVVMAKMRGQNKRWVREYFSMWVCTCYVMAEEDHVREVPLKPRRPLAVVLP
jgi:hypothetical protein